MADHPRTTKAKAAEVGNRFAALAAVPAAELEEEAQPESPAPAARAARPTAVRGAGPMPAEQKKPKRWPVRVPLNVDDEMRRALEEARLEDRIDNTARIRAMIQLWQEDDRLRARVNKRALHLR